MDSKSVENSADNSGQALDHDAQPSTPSRIAQLTGVELETSISAACKRKPSSICDELEPPSNQKRPKSASLLESPSPSIEEITSYVISAVCVSLPF